MNIKHLGVLTILAASIMWAVEPIVVKLSYQNSDFLHTSAVRAAVAVLIALVYLLLTKTSPLRVTKQQLSPLLYIALAGTLVADFLYYAALTQVPVVNAVILGHLQTIFIIVLAFFFLKSDTLNRYDYLGIAVLIISAVLVTTKTFDNLVALRFGTIGDLIVLAATISWATCSIVMKRYINTMHAGLITFYRFFFAALIFAAYLGVTASLSIDNLYQILVGVIIGIGTILYYEGLKRLKAAQVSALELSTPFFAAILGFFILNETLTLLQISGILLLFLGVYFISKKEP
ncbi:MAG: DMT family transporter [Candidatus Thermoplasmatota archaeon]|nr:DMT family transporter [Candidatus Thermoplasmatota archaeon]